MEVKDKLIHSGLVSQYSCHRSWSIMQTVIRDYKERLSDASSIVFDLFSLLIMCHTASNEYIPQHAIKGIIHVLCPNGTKYIINTAVARIVWRARCDYLGASLHLFSWAPRSDTRCICVDCTVDLYNKGQNAAAVLTPTQKLIFLEGFGVNELTKDSAANKK